MKGLFVVALLGMIMRAAAGVIALPPVPGLVRRDAIGPECGKGHFGGVFKSTIPLPSHPPRTFVCAWLIRGVVITIEPTIFVTVTTTIVKDVWIDCATATDAVCSTPTATVTTTTTDAAAQGYRR